MRERQLRILACIGSFNEEVERLLDALLRQTYRVDQVLVVDNASTIALRLPSPPERTIVVRNAENLGASGAFTTGLRYALDNHYDWIWIFDADTTPHDDALEQLIRLYESFGPDIQRQVGVLSCSQILGPTGRMFQGRRLTPGGPRVPEIVPDRPYCECDSILWSGSLLKLDVVRKVGMPRLGSRGYWHDFNMDYGDVEFSYRVGQAGYRLLVHRLSMVEHRVGKGRTRHLLGATLFSSNHSPTRRYLFFRNLVYFWLYIYPRRRWPTFVAWFSYRLGVTLLGVLFVEDDPFPKIWACVRGVWDGCRKRLHYQD